MDGPGNAYVTGYTLSTNFPTQSALQTSYGGSGDAFVAKIDSSFQVGIPIVYKDATASSW